MCISYQYESVFTKSPCKKVENIVNLWPREARKKIKIGSLSAGKEKKNSERLAQEHRAEVSRRLKGAP